MKSGGKSLAAAVLFVICATAVVSHAAADPQHRIKNAVDMSIRPVMAKYSIPGVAVGLTVAGETYVFSYGVVSTETRRPVTRDTLFEVGSVTKTFTATLASYAQVTGRLSLSDKTSKYLPALQDSKFGNVRLLNLGTHTPGGLPLQVPDNIGNDDDLGQYFVMLIEQRLFPVLGMKSSYINVPTAKMADYAQGYTKEGAPIRMATGELSSETYGIKTTASDLVRFVEANMNLIRLDKKFQRAITATHTGYFKAGPMTQDLMWEQYQYPVALKTLLEGNSPAMIFDATPVTEINPPEDPREDVWINKTGSTNGFGAYVAFVPEKRLGIVILANKSYPIEERVTAAYEILTAITDGK